MKHIISRRLILVMVLALASQASNLLAPTASTASFDFDIGSDYGDRNIFEFTVPERGCILAQIKPWSRSGTGGSPASKLALILNGPDQTDYYARIDGSASNVSPPWVSYAVTSTQVSRVRTWTISVINFTRSGTAKGTLNLEYPPTQMPCELKVAPSRTRGRIDLKWNYIGESFTGFFLIERSTDGEHWSVVSTCRKPSPTASTTSTSYSCSDTGLTSGTTYYYRACAITSGSKCGTKNRTPAMSVKAP